MIFKNILQSVYGPHYYSGIMKEATSGSAWKYYIKLGLLVSLSLSLIFSLTIYPKAKTVLDEVFQKTIAYIPDELEVTFKDGKASSNVKEPYFLKMPEELGKDLKNSSGFFENLLVIDTKSTFSLEKIKIYNSVTVLTQESLVVYDDGQLRVIELTQIPNTTVNKAKIVPIIEKVRPWIKVLFPFIAFAVFAFFIFMFAFYLLALVLEALVVWIVMKIRKIHGASYGMSYRLALHLATLPLIVQIVTMFGIPQLDRVPWLFTILFLVVSILNLKPRHA